MEKLVILARHGNYLDPFNNGRLNDLGVRQATCLGKYLKVEYGARAPFSFVSFTLDRSKHTTEILARELGVQLVEEDNWKVYDLLRENAWIYQYPGIIQKGSLEETVREAKFDVVIASLHGGINYKIVQGSGATENKVMGHCDHYIIKATSAGLNVVELVTLGQASKKVHDLSWTTDLETR